MASPKTALYITKELQTRLQAEKDLTESLSKEVKQLKEELTRERASKQNYKERCSTQEKKLGSLKLNVRSLQDRIEEQDDARIDHMGTMTSLYQHQRVLRQHIHESSALSSPRKITDLRSFKVMDRLTSGASDLKLPSVEQAQLQWKNDDLKLQAPTMSSQVADYEKQLEQQKAEIRSLREKNRSLKQHSRSLIHHKEALEFEVSKQTANKLYTEIYQGRDEKKIDVLKREREAANQKVTEAKHMTKFTEQKRTKVEQELQSVTTDVQNLSWKLSAKEGTLTQQRDAPIAKMNRQKMELEEEKESLEARINDAEAEIQDVKQQIRKAHGEVATAESETESLRQRHANGIEELTTSQENLKTVLQARRELRTQVTTLENSLRNITSHGAHARSQLLNECQAVADETERIKKSIQTIIAGPGAIDSLSLNDVQDNLDELRESWRKSPVYAVLTSQAADGKYVLSATMTRDVLAMINRVIDMTWQALKIGRQNYNLAKMSLGYEELKHSAMFAAAGVIVPEED
eukprot:GFYU01018849.1.p1 GENE.GFYU01018849.1~~GFYU01018849.1.p1  ORF type:complete len:520 (-),score=112.17 GFYU01018849.1:502-2061(-)